MPTPFMHLNMAYKMIARPELSPTLVDLIKRHWPAFCLGNIAADFQQICDIKRGKTHLYSTPPDPGDHAAFDRMLAKYPAMGEPQSLDVEHAVFLAGYGAHLLYDLVWYHNIVTIFTEGDWTDQMGRFIAHNTLLAYEDRQSLKQLPSGLGEQMMVVNPVGWLPFDPDNHLPAWQKIVADQLYPDAEIQTIQIFAKRMGLTPAEFSSRLDDEKWMQAQIFDHAPASATAQVLETSITMALEQTETYLAPIVH